MTPWLGRAGSGDAPTSAITFASLKICSGDRMRLEAILPAHVWDAPCRLRPAHEQVGQGGESREDRTAGREGRGHGSRRRRAAGEVERDWRWRRAPCRRRDARSRRIGRGDGALGAGARHHARRRVDHGAARRPREALQPQHRLRLGRIDRGRLPQDPHVRRRHRRPCVPRVGRRGTRRRAGGRPSRGLADRADGLLRRSLPGALPNPRPRGRRARPAAPRRGSGKASLTRVPAGRCLPVANSGSVARMNMKAVLFDLDFTLAKPGPDLGPEGYQRLGRRFGLELDPALYRDARTKAVEGLHKHPDFRHDEEIWVAFTERIIRGMGGNTDRAYDAAVEMTKAWEQAHNFDLFDDALPVLDHLREHGLKLGLVSNTGRDVDEFLAHHSVLVDAALSSRVHGKVKPHPTIFQAVLDRLGVPAERAAMIGDSPEDDLEGARALGMRAFLVDREGVYPDAPDRLPDLMALPAALGLTSSD